MKKESDKQSYAITTAKLLKVLTRECPNGVSFAPMALRLLKQKVPLKDSHIEGLKAQMFQVEDGLWFSIDMISDKKTHLLLVEKATEWLVKYDCFSIERLLEDFYGILRHVATPESFVAFLQHLGFTASTWRKSGFFCFQPPLSLDERLTQTAKTIGVLIEEAGGTLALNEIEETMPYLSAKALEGIRAQFLPEVHRLEVGGVLCWRSAEAIPLPEDFAEKLTTAVDTLVALDEKVSVARLEFALNLFYCIRFREEYALPDNGSFMCVCAKHYQGGHDVFPNTKKPCVEANDSAVSGRRVRSPNTRFRALGVSIGAKLVFTKDSHITCTVLDDSNRVKYDGKVWTISALAKHLLDVPTANGFAHFSCEGETLWDRRLRLEREGNQDAHQTSKMPPPAAVREPESEIIGLEGQPLSPATWRAFKSAGTTPRVADWSRRVENGESEETIAHESGLMVSTVKEYIKNRRRYLLVCETNSIRPEGGADV